MKKRVSFDFDGTLNEDFFGGKNPHKDEVQKLLVELFNDESFDVYIITRRFGPNNCNKGQKNEHEVVLNLLNQLNIQLPEEKIIFTNREYKYSFINKLDIDIHLDDDDREHELIKKFTKGSSVNVQHPKWREKFEELL
jgi:hypothetical protein